MCNKHEAVSVCIIITSFFLLLFFSFSFLLLSLMDRILLSILTVLHINRFANCYRFIITVRNST